ncbi:HlyD family efflux transporter periplasmic adaptor subunit [Staphylococcus simulans]|uniref:HlyD family secretion protein n=1 Tax=Staphylococcus simulans TaxID=1286 RepID=UPI0021D26FCE|nr:HlyD family efflux transporter periplasmic adaptor subunit [Staphylococcus simulans]UXR35910.1 HlyD family efflux transporter periplasmic adaptor subunit [Staphylococcus simulans]
MKKLIIINIVTIVVLVLIGIGGFYYYNQATSYIKTDNAKVDGQQIKIASPVSGKVESFDGKENKYYKKDEQIAEVAGKGEDGSPQKMDIKMPQAGTIVKTDAQEGGMVQAGSPMAYAYNLDELYITANVDETDIGDVEKGRKVDVKIDGQDSKMKGKVEQVGKATASSFSLMPSSNSDGNYTKVSQVVPVRISLENAPAKSVVPGMNAEVSIHK